MLSIYIEMEFSIIYAVIRPEITERVSIGIIIVDGEDITVRYSTKKINAVKALYSENNYKFIRKFMRSLSEDGNIGSTGEINYLARYSNNLIAFSELQTINLEPTKSNKEWLYRYYIYGRKN